MLDQGGLVVGISRDQNSSLPNPWSREFTTLDLFRTVHTQVIVPDNLAPERRTKLLCDSHRNLINDMLGTISVHWGSDYLTMRDVASLGSIERLEDLHLGGHALDKVRIEWSTLFPTIRSLTLVGTRLDKSQLAEIARMPGLEELSLDGSTVDGTAIEGLRNSRIRYLDAIGTELTGNCWDVFASMPYLERLDIAYTGICTPLPNAEREFAQLIELNLSGNFELGDDIADWIVRMPKLRILRLDETAASDALLKVIEGHGAISSIGIAECRITPAALSAFRKNRPDVIVTVK